MDGNRSQPETILVNTNKVAVLKFRYVMQIFVFLNATLKFYFQRHIRLNSEEYLGELNVDDIWIL